MKINFKKCPLAYNVNLRLFLYINYRNFSKRKKTFLNYLPFYKCLFIENNKTFEDNQAKLSCVVFHAYVRTKSSFFYKKDNTRFPPPFHITDIPREYNRRIKNKITHLKGNNKRLSTCSLRIYSQYLQYL